MGMAGLSLSTRRVQNKDLCLLTMFLCGQQITMHSKQLSGKLSS